MFVPIVLSRIFIENVVYVNTQVNKPFQGKNVEMKSLFDVTLPTN